MKKILLLIYILIFGLLTTSNQVNSQIIPDFLVNEQFSINGSDQSSPSLDGDGCENYVITWQDKRNGSNFDIYAQIFMNNDTVQLPNFKVNDDEINAKQENPAVAVASDMSFIIVWEDNRNNSRDIYAQRYSNDGIAIGNNFKVNDDQGYNDQNNACVSIDSCGNFVIAWMDRRYDNNRDIFCQRYSSDGTPLGNNVKVNDDTGNAYQLWPTISCDNNGDFIVIWSDTRNNDWRDIYAQRYSANGIAIGNNFQVNTDTEGTNHILADIARDGDGNYIVVWEDNRNGYFDIYAQRFLRDGTTVGDNFKINENSTNISHEDPSVSSDFAGNFTVCWEDNRNDYDDVYARRFSNDGNPVSGDFKVNTDPTSKKQIQTDIKVDNNGNFIICWEDHRFGFFGEIYSQSFSNDGTPINDNIKVNDDQLSGNQQWPAIACYTDGSFIIAWVDGRSQGRDIYAQRYTSAGVKIGENIKVNDDDIDNYTLSPSVDISPDGNFIITWADYREAEIFNIYAQRFSNDGTPLGNNFRVNFLSATLNYNPVVACKPNGGFIICWGDSDEGGKDELISYQKQIDKLYNSDSIYLAPNIWAQIFLSDGTPLGENFIVNDDLGMAAQLCPDISVDGNGNFVIAWVDWRNDAGEIFLQRYLGDGTPIGSNFLSENPLYSGFQNLPSIAYGASGNFTLAWLDYRNEKTDIFCRQFSSDGNPLGNSFQVNNNIEDDMLSYPCISIGENDNFIISWTDNRNETKDIYAQKYLSNGQAFKDNYRISNISAGEQNNCEVILSDNKAYAAWDDNRNEQTGFDIWANVMDWGSFVQEITLVEGYQFVSSNIDPVEPDMLDVLDEILDDNLSFVRNTSGQTLQKIGPNWINGIGDWIVDEGYLIKMFAEDSFTINGTLVDPSTPITVEAGFQFVSYFPENSMDALIAFETILNNDLDYIRNSQGQTLRKIGPVWVNGIGDCQPSEGYLVKMFADGEIIYPVSAKSSGKSKLNPTYFTFEGGNAADLVFTIYVDGLEIGDEVAAYDGDRIVGSVKINSTNTFDNELPVFSTLINGKGYEAGNPITLKVWSENNIVSADFTMESIYDSYVSDVYPEGDGKYSIVNITKEKIENKEETIFVYPNPSKGIFNISCEGIKGDIQINVFDLRGKEYYNFELKEVTSTQLDLTDLPAGVYFVNLSGKDFKYVKKIIIQ